MDRSPSTRQPFQFDPSRYPATPGCFLIKDSTGRNLSIGPTVNLRRRLEVLFSAESQAPGPTRTGSQLDDRIPRLVARLSEIEVVITHTHDQAVTLANDLLVRHHPPFNFATFLEPQNDAFIVQTGERFPRLIVENKRKQEKHGEPAARFGPFPSPAARNLLLKIINESLQLRTCDPMPKKACVLYQLHLCSGPCEGIISAESYAEKMKLAGEFLAAPQKGLSEYLSRQMLTAAEAMNFERAQNLRDQISALKQILDQIPSEPRIDHDQDVLYAAQGKAFLLKLRLGKLRDFDWLDFPPDPADQAFTVFLIDRYSHFCPPELILTGISDPAPVMNKLSDAFGHPVTITQPASGAALDLLQMAFENHAYRLKGSIPGRTQK